MLWLLAGILTFGLAGATALLLGLRGRRIDTHPVCRRCGFDLIGQAPPASHTCHASPGAPASPAPKGPAPVATGKPAEPAQPVESRAEHTTPQGGPRSAESSHPLANDRSGPDTPVCSECGADLTRRRAIRIGQRRRRPAVATLGAIALLVALATSTAIGWAAATNFDWNTVKPAWLLARELESRDPAIAEAAAEELRQRLAANQLAPARNGVPDTRTAERVARRILEFQADTQRPWNRSAGEIFERMWQKGLLPEEMVRQFVAQSSPIETHIRRRVPSGQPPPVRFDVERREGGGMLSCRAALIDITLAGEVLETGSYWFYVPLGDRQSAWRGNKEAPTERIQFLPEELYTLTGHNPYIPPGLELPPGTWPLSLRLLVRRDVIPPGQRRYSRSVSRGPVPAGPEPSDDSLAELARRHLLWGEGALPEGPPLFELIELTTEIEVVAPAARLVELITGADARGVADRIAATATLQPSGYGAPEAGRLTVHVTVEKDVPLDVAYRATLMLPNGDARDLGWFAHDRHRDRVWGRAFGLPLGDLSPWNTGDTLRIMFTPDPAAAATQAGMDQIAGEPFEVALTVPEPPEVINGH